MAEPVRADLSGKTCLVTGASAGIGLAAARGLARLGARVVMAVRDPAKGERARRSVMGATGREVEMAVVDLASRKSIRAFARDLTARHPKLDVLVTTPASGPSAGGSLPTASSSCGPRTSSTTSS